MVVAQPYLATGVLTQQEPYRVTEEATERQLEMVKSTIDIARDRNADFTVIPEYGVPGLEGINLIEEHLSSKAWRPGTILIGGVDGLSQEQYASVIETDSTCVDEANQSESVENDQWVNCCITWIKSKDGGLRRWVQPKLCPAWLELNTQHQTMYKGKSVFLFRGRRTNGEIFTFGTMVCFDWIAPGNPNPVQQLLAETHRLAGESQIPITWLFVIQHNPKPSHFEFLNSVVNFFRDESNPNATRKDTCLVFVNTAGRAGPGSCRTHGTSGLVLSPRTPIAIEGGLPTFAHDGSKYRDENNGILTGARCRDVLLRERGECIHSFDQVNPSQIQPGAAGRSYAVENATVHPARGKDHVLTPGRGVAAVVKWVNDQFDDMDTTLPAHDEGLEQELISVRDAVVTELRQAGSKNLDGVVRLATLGSAGNPDEWSDSEGDGLTHVVASLQIAAMGVRIVSVGTEGVHGVVCWQGQHIDVVAVQGPTHRKCMDHLLENPGRRQRRHLLLVSKDMHNTPFDRRDKNILRPRDSAQGVERRYTDGRNPNNQVGYQDLIGVLGSAKASNEVAEKLYG